MINILNPILKATKITKSDVIKTLLELGIGQNDLFVSDNTKHSYHPGRSGSINLKSIKGYLEK